MSARRAAAAVAGVALAAITAYAVAVWAVVSLADDQEFAA